MISHYLIRFGRTCTHPDLNSCMNKQMLFPTPLYTIPRVLGEHAAAVAAWIPTVMHRHDLHEDPLLLPFMQALERAIDGIVEDQRIGVQEYTCTGMWGNTNDQGQGHHVHTHSNNWLSGVYYPRAATAPIRFFDPRPAAQVIHPRVLEHTRENCKVWEHVPEEDSMIIFPSWLQHYVPENTSSTPRISMAFNIMMVGMLGDPHELQSSRIG